jgi:hypothetical protein
VNWKSVSCFLVAFFLFSLVAHAQAAQPNAAAVTSCPVEILHVSPSVVRVQIKNTSGKTIVGLIFNAALSDATERWKWFHWDFDPYRPLRDFGWNKRIKAGEKKRLTWEADLDFQHGGGGAFVLTRVLFADGSDWQAPIDTVPCKYAWHHRRKKGLLKPVELPPRE